MTLVWYALGLVWPWFSMTLVWYDLGLVQSIARILDPGNSRENQLDFFSLDHEK